MKTKIISGTITLAILVWTATLFFSKVTLLITIGLYLVYCAAQIIWLVYQGIVGEVEFRLWEKEKKRRGFQ